MLRLGLRLLLRLRLELRQGLDLGLGLSLSLGFMLCVTDANRIGWLLLLLIYVHSDGDLPKLLGSPLALT